MSNTTQTFTDILAECAEAVANGRLTIADCLNQHPTHQAELADLLPLLSKLQTGRQVTPAPAFRQTARQRLLDRLEPAAPVAVPVSAIAPPSLWHRLQAWWADATAVSPRPSLAWSLALVLILFLFVGSGTLYAASQSLPGNPLYPLNQTVENWRVELAANDESRVALQLAYADKRLHEAARLARRGDLVNMEQALTGYQSLMQQIAHTVQTADPATQANLSSRVEAATAGLDNSFASLLVAAGQEPGSEPPPAADEPLMADMILCGPETSSAFTHPVANRLALQYDTDYETILDWYCQGYGFGEIGLAYNLSEQTETAVADLFALRAAGYGWGQIMQQLDQLLPLLPEETPVPLPTPGPPDGRPVGPPDELPVGPPDHIDPPGLGPPDDIGPRRTPGPWRTPPGQLPDPPVTPGPPESPPGPPHGGTPPGGGPPGGGPPADPPGSGPPGGQPPGGGPPADPPGGGPPGGGPPGQSGDNPGQGSGRP
jgi:hypothetical protein